MFRSSILLKKSCPKNDLCQPRAVDASSHQPSFKPDGGVMTLSRNKKAHFVTKWASIIFSLQFLTDILNDPRNTLPATNARSNHTILFIQSFHIIQ